MKRVFIILVTIATFVTTTSAQGISSPWWSLRGGVNFSRLSSEYYSTDLLTGFSVGATYSYPISKSIPIYIEGGLYLQRRGAQDNGFLSESVSESKLVTHEIELPLLLGCQVALSRGWAIQGAVGLYYSIAVDGEFIVGDESFDLYREEMLQTLRDSEPKSQQLLHRSDFGVRVGVTATYLRYLFGIAFDGGLLNLYAPSFREVGYQAISSCFTLQAGYTF
ncbi:MAG: outer membrane beta-barrel protein [Rikenellaceae bacterium]